MPDLRAVRVPLLLAAALALAGPAAGQEWNGPRFLTPDPGGVGVAASQASLPGSTVDELSLLVDWWRPGKINLGFRAGWMNVGGAGSEGTLAGGVNTWFTLATRDTGAPLEVTATAGVGGSDEGLTVPVGVSVGRTFGAGALSVTPYVHPRLGVGVLGDGIRPMADVGVRVRAGLSWSLQAGMTLGEPDAFGVGLLWRPGGSPR